MNWAIGNKSSAIVGLIVGCELVMSCDVAIREESALFGQPEKRVRLLLGLIVGCELEMACDVAL